MDNYQLAVALTQVAVNGSLAIGGKKYDVNGDPTMAFHGKRGEFESCD